MIIINKLIDQDYQKCNELIDSNLGDSKYFKMLGWSSRQIKSQFEKNVNYSLGAFYEKKLIAFLIGNLIYVENVSEYEILLIYVKKSIRRKGVATKLIEFFSDIKNKIKLEKIVLEVAKNNISAIKLYTNNNFKLSNVRKDYYSISEKKIDAYCYIKEYEN